MCGILLDRQYIVCLWGHIILLKRLFLGNDSQTTGDRIWNYYWGELKTDTGLFELHL